MYPNQHHTHFPHIFNQTTQVYVLQTDTYYITPTAERPNAIHQPAFTRTPASRQREEMMMTDHIGHDLEPISATGGLTTVGHFCNDCGRDVTDDIQALEDYYETLEQYDRDLEQDLMHGPQSEMLEVSDDNEIWVARVGEGNGPKRSQLGKGVYLVSSGMIQTCFGPYRLEAQQADKGKK